MKIIIEDSSSVFIVNWKIKEFEPSNIFTKIDFPQKAHFDDFFPYQSIYDCNFSRNIMFEVLNDTEGKCS